MSEKSYWETFVTSPAVFFIVMAFIFASGFVAHAVYQKAVGIPSGGTVHKIDIEVWADEYRTEITFIDWGETEAGSNVIFTLWVENTGTKDILVNVYRNNTIPVNLVNYLQMDWTLDAQLNRMAPSEKKELVLTLSIDADIPNHLLGGFTFDIWFVGEKAD